MNLISKYILITLIVITMTIAPLQAIGYAPPQPHYMLSRLGIIGPYIDHPLSTPVGFTTDYKYRFTTAFGNYTVVLANGIRSYIVAPGHPMLPVYTYKVEVSGYIPADKVHAYIYVEHIGVKHLLKPIIPAPQPLFYGLRNQTLIYTMDEQIYSTDKFYPGKLVNIDVWHGMHGKTIIIVRYYPVQYDPMTGTLFYIDKASVYIEYPRPMPVAYAEKSILILTTDKLVGNVTKLADFYKSKGYNVTIVTTNYIWKNYKPINNITQYPGFYNPLFNDSYYNIIAKTYNWTLALKIIDYLNTTLGKYDNLLIIGNASDIPPSFYYHYKFFDPYNNWVPTDFFYASPDLDLAPNIYVGRIPFSNPEIVSDIIDKIINWYKSGITNSRDIYLSGGYPFSLSLMFGETALSTMNLFGQLSMFRVHMLTRTSLNYNRQAVLSILSGEKKALWYFALCHGSGTALGDKLIINTGSGTITAFETLASVNDLLSMKNNAAIPIVSSVACMNAAWDNNVPTYWFRYPSFGEAILLSPAGGIAYIGSARVAAELGVMFMIYNGIETVQYFGATYLHYNILKAYASLMGRTNETSLGYVVDKGILDYLASAPMIDNYVLGEAFKLSLLGDSNLILPVWKEPSEKAYINVKTLYKYSAEIPAGLIAFYARGSIPLYGITQKAIIGLTGTEDTIGIYNVKIVNSYGYLVNYDLVNRTDIYMPATGTYNYTLRFNKYVNGLILTKFSLFGWGEIRVLLGALGVIVSPTTASAGEPVILGVYGMDLMGARTVNVYVAGRLVIPDLPLSYGSVVWKFALPYIAPGSYNVTVLPTTYVSSNLILSLSKFLSQEITIAKEDNLVIISNAPPVVQPGNKVEILIQTVYAGKPVDAILKSYIVGPDGEKINPNITRLGTGTYKLILKPDKPGRYSVSIMAYFKDKYLELRGYNSFSLIAISSIYKGFDTITQKLYSLAEHFNENLTSLSNLIKTGVLPGIRSNNVLLGSLKQDVESYKPILDQLSSQLNNINTNLGSISGKLAKQETILNDLSSKTSELIGILNQAKTTIINAINTMSSNISQNITSLQNRLSTVTIYGEAGTILSVIILIAVIILGVIKKK